MSVNILEMNTISISFPGVKALDNAHFKALGGKVNCIVGENGAGKSTLVKILAGIYKRDSGEMLLNDKKLSISSLPEAKRKRINFIFQDTNLCDKLSVFDNYTLGKEINRLGVIDKEANYAKAQEDFKKLGVDINLDQPMQALSVAEKQIIEILKAFDEDSKVIVYDEPSSALTDSETQKLFKVINILKSEGVIIIYISHRLEEIFEIGDFVTVLRNGKTVGDMIPLDDINRAQLIDLIVGEGVFRDYDKKDEQNKTEKILQVTNLSTTDLTDITFDLHQGEILGITGLLGSGYDRLARTLYGLEKISKGEITYKGSRMESLSPRKLVQKGIGYIPENRREEALFGVLSVTENLSISSIKKYSKNGILDRKKEDAIVREYVKKLEIKTPNLIKRIRELSGGNQQKVVISRWLSSEAQLLLLVEPTHGIDVKTKTEIYNILKDISLNGISIMVFSTEYAELVTLCDRILIMEKGKIKKMLAGDEIGELALMHNM